MINGAESSGQIIDSQPRFQKLHFENETFASAVLVFFFKKILISRNNFAVLASSTDRHNLGGNLGVFLFVAICF